MVLLPLLLVMPLLEVHQRLIPCDVNLSLTGNADNAFDLQPTHLHLPSHEHRYVMVTFAPSAIRTYQATFSATVYRNPSCVLQFEMQGEGTLPRVPTIAPVPTGAVKVDFGRIRRGTLTRPVRLCNDGIVPATVRFDLDEGAGEFSFSGLGSLVTIAPSAQHDFQAGFTVAPERVGLRNGRLRMGVLRNVFEVTHLALSAQVYEEDVTPDHDVIDFGDVDMASPCSARCNCRTSRDAPALVADRSRRPECAGAGDDGHDSPSGRAEFTGDGHDSPSGRAEFTGDGHDSPSGRAEFTVAFRPTQRLLPFTVDVAVELDASGLRQHLLRLTGACHGVGLLLEQTLVPFGAVIAGSTLTKRVKLDNIGDVPRRFQWDVARLPQAWALEPATGVIAPHDHALIDVTFAPDVPGLDLRQTLRCVPDDNDAGAVQVQVTGSSVEAPADASVDLAFDAAVRGSQTVQVPITNTSTSVWQLHPVISDGAWSAPDLEVPAGATCNLAVVYAPLTTATNLHRGTLFMALPTGSALSYRLQGRTQAPALESDGACQVRAKCASTHTLPVRNWLHDPQRFRIDIQRESPPDDTVSITAGDSVGVPGGVSRDVRLQIYAYRPGTTVALVKFVNDDNGEYLVHRLTIVVTDAGIIDRIALQSPVRQRALTTVPLDNRLGRDCTLTSFSCESPDVDVRGLPRVRLTLSSAELGDFPYELELQAYAAAVDASLRFDAYLGATCTQRFRFLSWSKKPTTYECSFVGGQAFQVVGDKKVTCAGADANGDTGVECQVTVLFDPSGLNDVRDELKVTSTDAGEYRCALHGHCSVPRPEGPISITAGTSQAVRFRNLFGQRSEFVYTVDNPAFTIGKKGETIDTKKEVSIQVGFQGAQPTNGKLVVTCTGGADQATVPTWVYYLHGEPKK
ncbi:HYDIN/VesB/CFA65-like Ig-like domain-containing protein [Plasmodiophora brassicae]